MFSKPPPSASRPRLHTASRQMRDASRHCKRAALELCARPSFDDGLWPKTGQAPRLAHRLGVAAGVRAATRRGPSNTPTMTTLLPTGSSSMVGSIGFGDRFASLQRAATKLEPAQSSKHNSSPPRATRNSALPARTRSDLQLSTKELIRRGRALGSRARSADTSERASPSGWRHL
jgi:hypothetical protein